MKIRRGTFETNSSSTHSIAISKEKVNIPKGSTIKFHIGEYGWKEAEYAFPDYMYTALLDNRDFKSIEKLKNILDSWGVKYEFDKPQWDREWLIYGEIDHADEALPIMTEILADEDLLARALFGDATVYTGNDNGGEQERMSMCAEPYIWDYDEEKKEYVECPNPNHNSDKFDYFFKGN